MNAHVRCFSGIILSILGVLLLEGSVNGGEPFHSAELVFPLHHQHNHAPAIVETETGDLIVSWYRGSGERSADDVAIYGSRLRKGSSTWSEPFLMADTPGFPDCNTAMFIDSRERLWLFWPLILANTWESCLTQYRVSSDYSDDGSPNWSWQGSIPLQPQNFRPVMLEGLKHWMALSEINRDISDERLSMLTDRIDNKLLSRLGWQPRCKPTVLPTGRILLPLYSDTYSVSIMAISDDEGESWYASEPLAGFGNIQPAVLRRQDGTLIAYMRENGPLDHVRTATSIDDGITWSAVGTSGLPNPGSGLDAVVASSGRWIIIYNDTTSGRNSLAVSMSDDEGEAWKWTRHLERHDSGSYHYPAIIQGADRSLHAAYSYFVEGGKSMKHATFNEAWIEAGDEVE